VAALTEVRVPDLGEFADVPVIEVLVAPGQSVAEEEPLIVLESDKASMEVPAPAAGVVADVVVAVGDEVSQGDVILRLSGDGSSPAAEEVVASETWPQEEEPTEEEIEAVEEAEADDAPTAGYAGPGARRLARDLGVDLSTVNGSGHKGRITKQDVQAVADGSPGEPAAPAPSAPSPPVAEGLPPWPSVDFAAFGPIERVPLSRIKRIAGPNLSRNWVQIPHVTQHDDADVTDLEVFRKRVNAERKDEGVKLTIVSLLLKACAVALREFPEFNSSLEGEELVLKRYYHLGFAVDTPEGLVVPVIRDVDQKGLLDIARELVDLSSRAREGKLRREEIQGGTFSISSLGGIGGSYFTPIINAPEVAILGASRTRTAPVWDGAEFRPRLMLPLSLSYDHRVVDGAAAARFITYLGGLLADLQRALL
jgi:pyruvate dehydrogenase E2 component (dihydrolipoamide acetyltransferase)